VLLQILEGEHFDCPHNRGNNTKQQNKGSETMRVIIYNLKKYASSETEKGTT
jgi:hypothetical protein